MVLTAPRSAEHVFGLSPNARSVSDFFSKPYDSECEGGGNAPATRIARRGKFFIWVSDFFRDGSVRGILNDPSQRFQAVADGVGGIEILLGARFGAFSHEFRDFRGDIAR